MSVGLNVSESAMRRELARRMKHLDFRAIENPMVKGTPDVNFIDGWMELKWLKSWPKRQGTPVTIGHFTQHQRLWLRRRWQLGGRCFLTLQIAGEWLLITGADSWEVGHVSKDVLLSLTVLHTKHWDAQAMHDVLTLDFPKLEQLRRSKGLCGLPIPRSFISNAAEPD